MGIPPECWEGPFRPMVARPSTVDELLKGALTNCDTELSRVRGLLGELLAEREGLRVQRDDMAGLILGKDEQLEAMQAEIEALQQALAEMHNERAASLDRQGK